MSASANGMSNLQSVFEDFFGGGIAVNTPSGGFSTVLDPTTGSYKTTINAGGTTVKTAGVGQTVSAWTSLTSTTGGTLLLVGLGLIALLLVVGAFRGRG